MQDECVETILRLLLYATADSRRRLAEQLLEQNDAELWGLLAITARSAERALLRARCLEVLGLAAAAAEEDQAELILSALLG